MSLVSSGPKTARVITIIVTIIKILIRVTLRQRRCRETTQLGLKRVTDVDVRR